MEYENKEICQKCNGRCCKKSGCDYFTSDFDYISYDVLNETLQTGNVSIVAALKFSKIPNGKTVLTPFLYLRARNQDREIVDLFSMKRQCSMLDRNGCKYTLDERPGGGVNLIPKENGACAPEKNPLKEIEKWEPYQKTLARLVKRYCGMSVDQKLRQDIENVIYDCIMENYDGVAEEEIYDIYLCIGKLIECYPEEAKRAEKRSLKSAAYLVKNIK